MPDSTSHFHPDELITPAVVSHTEDVVPNVRIIHITADRFIDFKAGQYIPISWGGHEPRYYSIACAPEQGHIEIHVKRGAGAPSRYALDTLKIGDSVYLGAAGGDNIYDAALMNNKPLVLIAGGIGFTPQKAMIETALHHSRKTPLRFFWGTRKKEDQYMASYFQTLATEHDNFKFIPLTGGLMIDKILEEHEIGAHEAIFLAGAPEMINDALVKLRKKNITPDRIHFDNHPGIIIPAINDKC